MSTPKKLTAAAALALPLALLLAGCAGSGTDAAADGPAEDEVVRIGVVGAGDPYWETYKEAAAEEGIEVELVDFSEYTQPNPALSADELDLNQFQHIIYLATYNVQSDDDLQPIGATAIYPLGLYSIAVRRRSTTSPRARRSPCPTTSRTRPAGCSCCSRPASSSSRTAARSSRPSPTCCRSRRSRSRRSTPPSPRPRCPTSPPRSSTTTSSRTPG